MEIEMTQLALSSLDNIVSYIESMFSPTVAEHAYRQIKADIQKLALMPNIGKPVPWPIKGLRCLCSKQNQIIYRIVDDHVQVIIVWDGRQDPNRLLDLILQFFYHKNENNKL